MNAHTPGPWAVNDDDPTEVVTRHGRLVAACHYRGEAKANARLIAAAPELLEALLDCAAYLDALAGSKLVTGPSIDARRASARTAVAKAEEAS